MFKKYLSLKIIDAGLVLIIALSLFKLILHLIFNSNYDFYRDEYYYIACSQNLDFGYADHPPLIALITKYVISYFGYSIQALRFFPALAGTLAVFFTGIIVKKIGGGKFAIFVSMLAVIFSPIILFTGNILSVNAFSQLVWVSAFYVLLKITLSECRKCWILLGVIIGIGLQISYSVLILLFGLLALLIFSPERKWLKSVYLWIGFAIALLFFLPNIVWQTVNGFPTIEYCLNLFNDESNSPADLLSRQMILMHPISFVLLAVGLIYLHVSKELLHLKKCGWLYLVAFFLLGILNSKPGQFTAVYPIMFAFGAAALGSLLSKYSLHWVKYLILILIIPAHLMLAPMSLPILPTELFIKFENRMDFRFLLFEKDESGKLPRHFADMFGWENLVSTVAGVYNSLNEKEKKKCLILAENIGEAGAIDFYGGKYDLPKAISGHNNYWFWQPEEFSGEIVIAIGGGFKRNFDLFEEVEPVQIIYSELAWGDETGVPIYICKKMKISPEQFWEEIKHFD